MKSVIIGTQSILGGYNSVVLAGGMESMSNVPYYVDKIRTGVKMGNQEMIDGMLKDGLVDAYKQIHAGVIADRTAEKYEISREEQDAFTVQSYQRTARASENGWFKEEITPVEVPQRKGEALIIKEDEEYKNVSFEKIPLLRPAFSKEGTVTAANASTINDGAAALVLAGKKTVEELGITPMARILSFADTAHEPEW